MHVYVYVHVCTLLVLSQTLSGGAGAETSTVYTSISTPLLTNDFIFITTFAIHVYRKAFYIHLHTCNMYNVHVHAPEVACSLCSIPTIIVRGDMHNVNVFFF